MLEGSSFFYLKKSLVLKEGDYFVSVEIKCELTKKCVLSGVAASDSDE